MQMQVETEEVKSQRMAIIEAFSEIIKEKRSDAIEAKRASGVNEEVQEDIDHYDGVDVANRSKSSKGRTPTDSVRDTKDTANRSTVFLKITRPYVDAAAARVADMLLPTDDRNFAIKPEPRPELTSMVKNAEQPAAPVQVAGQPPQPQAQPDPLVVQAQQQLAQAKATAERAQEEIDDWLVQCRYHAEVRKCIESAAKIGTGILKGPHPVMIRKRAAKQASIEEGGGWTVEMVEKLAPISKNVKYENFYPDGTCGDDIQRGSFVFECDDISQRRLLELKADTTYIPEMIDLCIEEGPTSPTDGTRKLKEGEKSSGKDLFQIWYFHGMVSKKDMQAAGCKCTDKDSYPAIVTMVNDRVIKVTLSTLDSGEFPYDVMVWQAKPDHWSGVGVARQMRECQKGANAAVRNLMDNAGLSAGPQIIINRNKIVPANNKWELTPRKVWYTRQDEDVENVRDAFMIVTVETRQAELMAILQFWLKEAEDVTGLPMLLQGQQGGAPVTLGGTQIMNNNGSTVLRRIARTYDDRVTEPHIGRYYEWLLLYGPDEAKGQFTIDARGSSALVERDMQAQQIAQMVGLSLNPAYGLDPQLVINEFLKSMRFDPKAMQLSDEKKQAMAQQAPPEDPRITAAKIAVQGDIEREKMESQQVNDRIAADAHLAMNQMAFEQQENDKDRLAGQHKHDTGLSSGERQVLEKIKAGLAEKSAALNLTKELALADHTSDLHKYHNPQLTTPAIEPAGRAEDGQAFAQ